MRVLIVDNDKITRLIISRLLKKKLTDDILEAENGLDALEIIEKNKPELIFLDLSMPLMDGIETLEIIRSIDKFKNIPVIILSSNKDREKIAKLLELGISDYIVKPIDLTKAYQKISNLFEKIRDNSKSYQIFNFSNPNKEKLLLVHPDRDFLINFNEQFGEIYNVIFAENGNAGYTFFTQYQPKIVLLGEKIPIISEIQLAQKIKSIDINKEIKIYYLGSQDISRYHELFIGKIPYTNDIKEFTRNFFTVLLSGQNLSKFLSNFIKQNILDFTLKTIISSIKTYTKQNINVIPLENLSTVPTEVLFQLDYTDKNARVSIIASLITGLNEALKIGEYHYNQIIKLDSNFLKSIETLLKGILDNILSKVIDLLELNFQKSEIVYRTKNESNIATNQLITLPLIINNNEKIIISLDVSEYIDK
ncbi:MAG TPA: response regulator [Ignavibacteriales bacterium]|nr:response regulator [Ignavibacteriales bacterium]HPD68147.1 response regulator [Ignavibacteriales bacterium]HRT98199.1 response regulator [Ignavibacteriales bacterium]